MLNEIKVFTKKIRDAVYGIEVRENIASTFEKFGELEDNHISDTNTKINTQNNRINELEDKYNQVITSGGDSVLEIVDARVPFKSLKEKLDWVEKEAINGDADVWLGGSRNKKIVILDADNETRGVISRDSIDFDNIKVSNLNADNVDLYQNAITIYVSNSGNDINTGTASSPKRTLKGALNSINKNLQGTVNITILSGTYNEGTIFLSGFKSNRLTINLDNATINANFDFYDCFNIGVYGTGNINQLVGTIYHIRSLNSYIELGGGLIFNGTTGTQLGITATNGGKIAIRNCIVNNYTGWAGAMYANTGGHIISHTVKGSNNNTAYYAEIGGIITIGGPTRAYGGIVISDDSIYKLAASAIATNADGTTGTPVIPPTPEVQPSTKFYYPQAYKSYRAIDGWKDGIWQGRYNSSNPLSYNYYGCYMLNGAAIRADLAGKTITLAQLRIKRKTVGGSEGAVNVRIYGSTATYATTTQPALSYDYGIIGSVLWGKELVVKISTTVVQNIVSNGINSLILHFPDGSNYALFENAFELYVEYK